MVWQLCPSWNGPSSLCTSDKGSFPINWALKKACEPLWKRWMGYCRGGKDNYVVPFFPPVLLVPCTSVLSPFPQSNARYAKSLNTAVKRRRRVCQYGSHAFLSFSLLRIGEQPANRDISVNVAPKYSSRTNPASVTGTGVTPFYSFNEITRLRRNT